MFGSILDMDNYEGAANPTGKDVFDASQYEFFGNNILGDVELGGLEEDEDGIPFPELGELEDVEFPAGKEEADVPGSISSIDDLSSTFFKLNKLVNRPAIAGVSGDWGFKESSSAAERAQDADSTSWVDQRAFGAEAFYEGQNLLSQSYSSSTHITEPNSLHRTSTYPEPHPLQRQQHSTEPIIIPNSSFSSYPPHVGTSPHASPNPNSSYQPGIRQMPIASPNRYPSLNPQLQSTTLPQRSQFGGYSTPHGLSVNHQLQNQWVNQNGAYPRNQHLPSQQLPHQNGLITPQTIPPQYPPQIRIQHPHQQSPDHYRGPHPQMFGPHPSPPRMNNFGMFGLPDSSDLRAISMVRNRQGMHYPPQGFDFGGPRIHGWWPRFRSKYMGADEIENIIRMQVAATHTTDPYVEDYYHQASLARKSAGAKLRHHFCPTHLRDGSSLSSTSNEPHAFLRVDGLGRVALPSIRRPRPLLEVEPANSSLPTSGDAESELTEKPLEQEPMLAARLAIENGRCFLLEIDDIDRFLQYNQPPDDGELAQRRQVLLEGLASSLQLVDPLGKNEATVNLAPEDDLVFVRIVSLVKGKKLLLRYLQLLSPGELLRVVCMAIFRNLRLLFGNMSSDPETSATSASLAQTVSSRVRHMDLKSLAACLASVVCSSKHPPLHPVGSSYGDGASVVLKSVLERATEILTSSTHADGGCSPANRALWQASFDAFFGLIMIYCGNKYDSVLQSSPDGGSDMAKAIAREMPVELLHASIPHTNEQQKQILLEFSKRSMPVKS